MKLTKILLAICFLFQVFTTSATVKFEYSKAGFFVLENSPRKTYSFNPGWKFYKGALKTQPIELNYNDKEWESVNVPHGLEYVTEEASGCANYQGEAWYRKKFTLSEEMKGKQIQLNFEAIMGKSKIWINGTLIKEHFGGYLPVICYIQDYIKWDETNIITVWADNSDDPAYPPGKAQKVLDFAYFGGIYRDVWLVSHESVFVTNPNDENIVAGGGVFVSYDKVTKEEAIVRVNVDIKNSRKTSFNGKVVLKLTDRDGKVKSASKGISIKSANSSTISEVIKIKVPKLWSPSDPHLYNLEVRVIENGKEVDGVKLRSGIRSIEMRGIEGFFLNGELYPKPLMGANRHQDFAIIGNALSNSLHWRDAYKLRSAGFELIRNAHYPQDPAFMDACDELGLFVIVNTPGWQFWNNEAPFEDRVYSDIRNMVRRDRNHASVLMWEPILNESHYPSYFAEKVEKMVKEEFPYSGVYSASDRVAQGHEYYPVIYHHPMLGKNREETIKRYDPKKSYYTREWGDNVDNWTSHNSTSRVARQWGEAAQLIQANQYASYPYSHTSLKTFYKTYPMVFGGALWHAFDHQRGYHPDPFFGGVMDAFRQPKYSYYMFMSQREQEVNNNIAAASGPMIYIANEFTPFSSPDVTIFTNCDEVRLSAFNGERLFSTKIDKTIKDTIPSPIIVFENAYEFMRDKTLCRAKKIDEVVFVAEGLIDGKVVATHTRKPARRATEIRLSIDSDSLGMVANGSDQVVVVATIVDSNGEVKRLNNSYIRFEIEGEGEIVGDNLLTINPRAVLWGDAPIIVRSTTTPGKIKVKASILHPSLEGPAPAVIEFESTASDVPLIFSPTEMKQNKRISSGQSGVKGEKNNLSEVEEQQNFFGE